MEATGPQGSGSRSVERNPLGNQIASTLRRDILLGVIPPGTRLAQQQLCGQFGTSRMPVRDALKILTTEGLLIRDPGQHMVVAAVSRQDLQDSFAIEGMLAGYAAERASRNAAPADLEALGELHLGMLAAARRGDFQQMSELNWLFHRHINRLAGSRKLIAALRAASLDLPRTYLAHVTEAGAVSNREHGAILDAMGKKKHAQAKRLMTEHIVNAGEGLISHLENVAGLPN